DNSAINDVPPLTADFTFYGGMYRDVNMIVVDPLHIDLDDMGASGVYVTPTNVTSASANLSVKVRVNNEKTVADATNVSVAIKDAGGATVATLTGSCPPAAGATAVATVTGTISHPH